MRVRAAAYVLCRDGEGRILLTRFVESGNPNTGQWTMPGGGMEWGEQSYETAARELHEETGLAAEPASTGQSFTYVPEDWEPHAGIGLVRVDCFVADAPPAWEPQLDWEHDGYRWCGADEAAELLFWPEPRALVRQLA